jgi:hypothetical protein
MECRQVDIKDRAAFSIPEWAERNRVSVSLYHKLQKEGLGPRVMRVGKRTLISAEADAQWRRDREAESNPHQVMGAL